MPTVFVYIAQVVLGSGVITSFRCIGEPPYAYRLFRSRRLAKKYAKRMGYRFVERDEWSRAFFGGLVRKDEM